MVRNPRTLSPTSEKFEVMTGRSRSWSAFVHSLDHDIQMHLPGGHSGWLEADSMRDVEDNAA